MIVAEAANIILRKSGNLVAIPLINCKNEITSIIIVVEKLFSRLKKVGKSKTVATAEQLSPVALSP